MKKLMIISMMILGTVAFARGGSVDSDRDFSNRDFEFNERRDIVEPMKENIDRMSRFTPAEWAMDKEKTEENLKKYEDFHRDLERSDMGENSQR